jgi:hypothetical protein
MCTIIIVTVWRCIIIVCCIVTMPLQFGIALYTLWLCTDHYTHIIFLMDKMSISSSLDPAHPPPTHTHTTQLDATSPSTPSARLAIPTTELPRRHHPSPSHPPKSCPTPYSCIMPWRWRHPSSFYPLWQRHSPLEEQQRGIVHGGWPCWQCEGPRQARL